MKSFRRDWKKLIFPDFHSRPQHIVFTLSVFDAFVCLKDFFPLFQTEQFTVLWILFATIVLGNSAVLITLYLNKRKSRMNFFIKQLAFAGKQSHRTQWIVFDEGKLRRKLKENWQYWDWENERGNPKWLLSDIHMSAFDYWCFNMTSSIEAILCAEKFLKKLMNFGEFFSRFQFWYQKLFEMEMKGIFLKENYLLQENCEHKLLKKFAWKSKNIVERVVRKY